MRAPFLERLAQGPLIADGAMGTLLYERGVPFGHCFDQANLSNPGLVEAIHRDYLAAGAELIETNTFGANHLRLLAYGLEKEVRLIARQGARVARGAREIAGGGRDAGPSPRPVGPGRRLHWIVCLHR